MVRVFNRYLYKCFNFSIKWRGNEKTRPQFLFKLHRVIAIFLQALISHAFSTIIEQSDEKEETRERGS